MQPLKIRKHLNEERTCVRLCSIWKLNASEKQRRKRAVFIAFWGNSSQIRENMERWWKKWINEKGKRIFLQRLMELDWRSRRISWSLTLKWSSFQSLHVFFSQNSDVNQERPEYHDEKKTFNYNQVSNLSYCNFIGKFIIIGNKQWLHIRVLIFLIKTKISCKIYFSAYF